jgi:hypothetical protein
MTMYVFLSAVVQAALLLLTGQSNSDSVFLIILAILTLIEIIFEVVVYAKRTIDINIIFDPGFYFIWNVLKSLAWGFGSAISIISNFQDEGRLSLAYVSLAGSMQDLYFSLYLSNDRGQKSG